jgi:hypothetical protein
MQPFPVSLAGCLRNLLKQPRECFLVICGKAGDAGGLIP